MKTALPGALCLLLFSRLASAQVDGRVPPGFVPLVDVGQIRVWARDKDAVGDPCSRAVKQALSQWHSAFSKRIGLSEEVRHVGAEGGLFSTTARQAVVVLLFDREADYSAWRAASEASSLAPPADGYVDILAARVGPDGILEADRPALFRDLSHALLRFRLYLGEPAWLDHGLALYSELLSDTKNVLDPAALEPALKELRPPEIRREPTPIYGLLTTSQGGFDARRRAEAMTLVHLLVNYAPDLFRDLVRVLVGLEACAWGNPPGVGEDERRYSHHLLVTAFGKEDRLQKVWDNYVQSLLDGKGQVVRPSPAPRLAPQQPEGEMSLWLPLKPELAKDGNKMVSRCFPTGKFRQTLSGAVDVTVTADYGEGPGHWHDAICLTSASHLQERAIEFRDIRAYPSAVLGGHLYLRVMADWTTAAGGAYRTIRTLLIR